MRHIKAALLLLVAALIALSACAPAQDISGPAPSPKAAQTAPAEKPAEQSAAPTDAPEAEPTDAPGAEPSAEPTGAPDAQPAPTDAPIDGDGALEPQAAPASAPIGVSGELMSGVSKILTGLMLANLATGSEYSPEKGADADYSRAFVSGMANRYYFSRAKQYPSIQDASFERYIRLEAEELSYLLCAAFGAGAAPAPDGDSLIESGGAFFAGAQEDGYSVSVAYADKPGGFFDEEEDYHFICTYGEPGAADTTVKMRVRLCDAKGTNPLGVCVTAFAPEQ